MSPRGKTAPGRGHTTYRAQREDLPHSTGVVKDKRLQIVSVFNGVLWQRYKLSKKKRVLGLEKAWHGLNKAE